MAALTMKLAQRFDVVLIDTPPVLPVVDAVAISAIAADHVLMVVRSGQLSRDEFAQALSLLKDADAHVIGIVMTDCEGSDTYRYY